MRKKIYIILIIIPVIILVIDLYVFSGINWILRSSDYQTIAAFVKIIYWIIPFFFTISFLIIMNQFSGSRNPRRYSLIFKMVGIFILIYLPKIIFSVFLLIQDIITSLYLIVILIGNAENPGINSAFRNGAFNFISEGAFILSAIIFLAILYGITFGRFNFRIRRINLSFDNLPDVFNGFRIIQISDLHTGSLQGLQQKIMKAIDLINKEKPDLIFFTGDMVNDFAEEMDGWIHILKQLHAKHGKFSILGNHDYGEYFPWTDLKEKQENIGKIVEQEKKMGFRVLLNESELIEKESQQIAVVGVENWGLPPFRQYGNLKKALSNIPDHYFKILLSHDPSHWDSEVAGKTDVSLTLSGHTHGFQFGIRAGRFKWSPVKFIYPRWEGLHRCGNQFLNINTGLGYIGFPGRIGIPPEITVIQLGKE